VGAFREVMASISCIRQSLELENFEQGAPVIDRAATTSPATVSLDMRVLEHRAGMASILGNFQGVPHSLDPPGCFYACLISWVRWIILCSVITLRRVADIGFDATSPPPPCTQILDDLSIPDGLDPPPVAYKGCGNDGCAEVVDASFPAYDHLCFRVHRSSHSRSPGFDPASEKSPSLVPGAATASGVVRKVVISPWKQGGGGRKSPHVASHEEMPVGRRLSVTGEQGDGPETPSDRHGKEDKVACFRATSQDPMETSITGAACPLRSQQPPLRQQGEEGGKEEVEGRGGAGEARYGQRPSQRQHGQREGEEEEEEGRRGDAPRPLRQADGAADKGDEEGSVQVSTEVQRRLPPSREGGKEGREGEEKASRERKTLQAVARLDLDDQASPLWLAESMARSTPSSSLSSSSSSSSILRKQSAFLPPSPGLSCSPSSNGKKGIRFADAMGQALAAVRYSQRLQYSPTAVPQRWEEGGREEGWEEVTEEEEEWNVEWMGEEDGEEEEEGEQEGWWTLWPSELSAFKRRQMAAARRRRRLRKELRRRAEEEREQAQRKAQEGKAVELKEDLAGGRGAEKYRRYTEAKRSRIPLPPSPPTSPRTVGARLVRGKASKGSKVGLAPWWEGGKGEEDGEKGRRAGRWEGAGRSAREGKREMGEREGEKAARDVQAQCCVVS